MTWSILRWRRSVRVFLNLVGFLVGDLLLFVGLYDDPHVAWMVWSGAILLVVTVGIFVHMLKSSKKSNRD